jgi:DNA-binding transcriptional regulator YiaG
MFGSKRPDDELRKLLKACLGYKEDSTTLEASIANEARAEELGKLLGVDASTVRAWTLGTARPTPPEERRAVTVLQALKTFEKA